MGHTVINLLEYSEKHTADQKASPVFHKPSTKHDDTPGSHNESDPERRSLELHEDRIGWYLQHMSARPAFTQNARPSYLEQDVRDEEHHVRNIVVGAMHV